MSFLKNKSHLAPWGILTISILSLSLGTISFLYIYNKDKTPELIIVPSSNNPTEEKSGETASTSPTTSHTTVKTKEADLNSPKKDKPIKTISIIDLKTNKRSKYIESYIQRLCKKNNLNPNLINGSVEIDYSPNKTTGGIRGTLFFDLSYKSTSIDIPTIYGRGDSKREVLSHALQHNNSILEKSLSNL